MQRSTDWLPWKLMQVLPFKEEDVCDEEGGRAIYIKTFLFCSLHWSEFKAMTAFEAISNIFFNHLWLDSESE